MTLSALQAWWDSVMSSLATRFPRLGFIINAVKVLGDDFIPTISTAIPALPTPRQAFDWLMGQLEAAYPNEAFFLSLIQGLVDGWLGQAGTLPALPA